MAAANGNFTTPRRSTVRCAIYTRKSTEEGLEQEFNTLDAQRDAAEAFIRSQRGEGWVALEEHYDDGGFAGANMDRPALQKLLQDVRDGLVDCVMVYKVDRLTRSLLDFAQFEREMIAERTRDTMSAARRKGRWIGGSMRSAVPESRRSGFRQHRRKPPEFHRNPGIPGDKTRSPQIKGSVILQRQRAGAVGPDTDNASELLELHPGGREIARVSARSQRPEAVVAPGPHTAIAKEKDGATQIHRRAEVRGQRLRFERRAEFVRCSCAYWPCATPQPPRSVGQPRCGHARHSIDLSHAGQTTDLRGNSTILRIT
jgi:hypothetical protein